MKVDLGLAPAQTYSSCRNYVAIWNQSAEVVQVCRTVKDASFVLKIGVMVQDIRYKRSLILHG